MKKRRHYQHYYYFKKLSVCSCVYAVVCSLHYTLKKRGESGSVHLYVGVGNRKAVWMCGGKEVTRTRTSFFLLNTLLSLLEPCLAVILKKSELRTDGGSPRLFFPCFSLFLWYFSSFFVRALWLLLFCGMDNINKRDSRERKKKKEIYNLYYTVLWTKYKSITLCYIYIIIFLEFSSWDGKIFFFCLLVIILTLFWAPLMTLIVLNNIIIIIIFIVLIWGRTLPAGMTDLLMPHPNTHPPDTV